MARGGATGLSSLRNLIVEVNTLAQGTDLGPFSVVEDSGTGTVYVVGKNIITIVNATLINNNTFVRDAHTAGVWDSLLFVGGENNVRSIFAPTYIVESIRADAGLLAFLAMPDAYRVAVWTSITTLESLNANVYHTNGTISPVTETVDGSFLVDTATDTTMYYGPAAIEFLVGSTKPTSFSGQVMITNTSGKPIVISVDGETVTLSEPGTIFLNNVNPSLNIEFLDVRGVTTVTVTKQSPSWYDTYNETNYPELFGQYGYNTSGIISSSTMANKGVIVVAASQRTDIFTGDPGSERFIDDMTKGNPVLGISMVSTDIASDYVDYRTVRPSEALHIHPSIEEAEVTKEMKEMYLCLEGQMGLLIMGPSGPELKILNAGEAIIVDSDVAHAIVAVSGPYKHLVYKFPATYHYGLIFKETTMTIDEFYAAYPGTQSQFQTLMEQATP